LDGEFVISEHHALNRLVFSRTFCELAWCCFDWSLLKLNVTKIYYAWKKMVNGLILQKYQNVFEITSNSHLEIAW
jgi:hypothetical protein